MLTPPPKTNAPDRAPGTVEELIAKNVTSIITLERAARAQGSWTDRAADIITRFCGSFSFAVVHFFLFAIWILGNTVLLPAPFDPYPFTFLTFVVSLEAIFLTTFILVGESRQQRIEEQRSQLDLQINLLSEQENTKMLTLLKSIANKLGIDASGDPDIAVLEQAMRPEKLVEQIEKTNAENERAAKAPPAAP